MQAIREFLIPGGKIGQFNAFMRRMMAVRCPYVASGGERLGFDDSINPGVPEDTCAVWHVYLLDTSERAPQATVEAFEEFSGVHVLFMDGRSPFYGRSEPPIGKPFEEFAQAFGEMAGLLPEQEETEESPESGPWDVIADPRDREMVRLWWECMSNSDIAKELVRLGFGDLAPITVTKRLSTLRRDFGCGVVPRDEDRRVHRK